MTAILFLLLYTLTTAPLLGVALWVHRMRSDYTRWFMAALILQLIPLGLIFFPLGLLGIGMLGYTGAATWRRNRRFRHGGFDNPEVHRRWTAEALANALALGLAVEQKALAAALTIAARPQAGFQVWMWVALGSLALWSALLPWLIGEWRIWRALPPASGEMPNHPA